MRWVTLVGISLCTSVLGAAVLVRAMKGRTTHTENVSTAQSIESAPLADDNTAPPDIEPAAVVPPVTNDVSNSASQEDRQELTGSLRAALRARDRAKAQDKGASSDSVEVSVPQAGPEVDDLARQLAPALAQEALSESKQASPQMLEVTGELMDTWKEQKEILAGQRATVDSILLEAH